MAQLEQKTQTKEKVYNVTAFITLPVDIPVLGVDEEDAKNNLPSLYFNKSYKHTDDLLKEYDDFLKMTRGYGWIGVGGVEPYMEVHKGDERLRDYLLEQPEKRTQQYIREYQLEEQREREETA